MLDILIVCFNQDLQRCEFSHLLSLITVEKRKRIEKYHSYIDAQRTLIGDILARYSICKCHNLKNADLNFCANEYGKPFLANMPNIKYNISHAGHYVACVISEGLSVGIDVEEIKPNDMKIAKRFFAKDEADYLLNQPANLHTKIFYQLWTMKESYIKMIGKGLSIPLDSFSVLKLAETNQACFQQFMKNEYIIGHICTEEADDISCIFIGCSELLKWAEVQLE